MFRDATLRAIAVAPLGPQLDRLSSEVWAAYAAGALDGDAAQSAAEAIEARRKAEAKPSPFLSATSSGPGCGRQKPKRPTSPDRRASIERRRRLVASGPLPPSLAARFTWGEQAVMRIVGDECRAHGTCSLCIDAIAARAGVHRTTVQNALREAQGRGEVPGVPLVTVAERRRRGQRSLTNIIKVVSTEWTDWLRKGRRPVGSNCTMTVKNLSSTDTSKKESGARIDAPGRREPVSSGRSPHPYGGVVPGDSRIEARR
jgi:hypothetical protein